MTDALNNYLFVINDSPYGSERPYNALRLALNLVKRPEIHVQVFLMGDGVNCAIAGQKTLDGYYNVERMLKSLAQRGQVATCQTCFEARGITPERFVEGVKPGNMDLLGEWTVAADKVLLF